MLLGEQSHVGGPRRKDENLSGAIPSWPPRPCEYPPEGVKGKEGDGKNADGGFQRWSRNNGGGESLQPGGRQSRESVSVSDRKADSQNIGVKRTRA
jgi:hypothetical protein